MINSRRKQVLVKLPDEIRGHQFINYLEKEGFTNAHKITYDKLRIKVLVISGKKFFSTNVTCLAALASCGINPISVDKFKTEFELQTNATNSL